MSNRLTCLVSPRLDVVTPEQWTRLFPDLPDSLEMIRFIQDCRVPGFRFHSVTVWDGERPVLLLPLFETEYQFATLLDGRLQRILQAVARRAPRLTGLRMLGVGFVECEWGQVGIDRDAGRPLLEAAWEEALRALETLAEGLEAHLTVFVNFTAQSGQMLPIRRLQGFAPMHGLPFARTPMAYADVDAYVANLSANMRSSLRRKLRKAREVRIVRTREPGPWLKDIYRFYADTCERSDVQFSRHGLEFFASVCRRIAEAQYVLYFVGERLAAFRLQAVRPDCLIDKYFGMDPEIGREHNLYFVSWVKDIEYCIANRIPVYHSGLTAETTKARLGASFVPSLILFKHRHPLVHQILALLARYRGYRPEVAVPPVRLGSDWDSPDSLAADATATAPHGVASGDALGNAACVYAVQNRC